MTRSVQYHNNDDNRLDWKLELKVVVHLFRFLTLLVCVVFVKHAFLVIMLELT